MSPVSLLSPVPGAPAAPAAPAEPEAAHLPCELCGGRRGEVLFHLSDPTGARLRVARGQARRRRAGTFVRCRSCGLIARNPRPWSWPALRTLTPPGALARHRRRLEAAAAPWTRSLRGKDVLVVGCGSPHLLRKLARKGLRPVGIEPDPSETDAAWAASRLPKPPIHRRSLEVLDFAEASFDGAVAIDSLGCLPDPTRTLLEIHRLLKPRGTFLVTVPQACAVGARLFGHRWALLDAAHTLFWFDAGTLATLVEETGWRIRSIRQESDPFAWTCSIERRLRDTGRIRAAAACRAAAPLLRAFLWAAIRPLCWSGRGDRIVLLLEKR